jgi:hypothetical protein
MKVSGFLTSAFVQAALSTRLKKAMRKDSLFTTNSFLKVKNKILPSAPTPYKAFFTTHPKAPGTRGLLIRQFS